MAPDGSNNSSLPPAQFDDASGNSGAPDLANIQATQQQNDIAAKNSIVGADLAAQEDGSSSRSIYDRATDYISKGVPLTGAAVVNSFVNTAVEAGNFFGGDFHKATIEDEFGQDSSYTDYYNQNKGFIEGSALLAGSLLPGLGATKLLKLATVSGTFGETFSAATGLLSGIRDDAIAEAIGDAGANAAGTSLFGGNLVQKAKAIASGIGDSAFQGAVYQTATLATMHANPLTDNNTIADDVKDVLDASLQFGVLGGIGEGISALRQIKTGVLLQDAATKEQEIVGSKGLGNLTPGDRIIGLLSRQKELEVSNSQNPQSVLAQRKFQAATNVVNRQLGIHFGELAGGDTDLANSMQKFVVDAAQKLVTPNSANVPDFSSLADQIGQLAQIGRINNPKIATAAQDVFYVKPKMDLPSLLQVSPGNKVSLDSISSKISQASDNTLLSKALTLRDPNIQPVVAHALEPSDTSLISLANVGPSNLTSVVPKYTGAQDAYSKGVDIFIDANGGTHINLSKDSALVQTARPGEGRILTAAERQAYANTGNLPGGSKPLNSSALFLNLKDGGLFGEAPLPVVGDLGAVKQVGNQLRVGDNLTYNFAPPTGQKFAPVETLADPKPFSGTMNLTHFPQYGQEAPNSFIDPSSISLDQRYDGDGGSFGSNGVYLDNTGGEWAHILGRDLSTGVNVKATFNNAYTLTPNTLDQFISTMRGVPKANTYFTGEEVSSALKAKGYDGIIVHGFQNPDYPGIASGGHAAEVAKLNAAGLGEQLTQSQVFHFEPKQLQVTGKYQVPQQLQDSLDARKAEFAKLDAGGSVDQYALDQSFNKDLAYRDAQSKIINRGILELNQAKPATNDQLLRANAEYTWNSLRGIKDGDVIDPEHLPQLEALYNDMAAHEAKGGDIPYDEAKDVSFSDGSELPQDSNDLLQYISDLKQQKIAEYIQDGKNADEIGHLTNSPQSFISNPTNAVDASKIIIPASDHMQINTVRLAYDIGTTKDQAGNILRGMQATNYRYQLATQANTDATAKYLNTILPSNKAVDALSNLKITKTAGDATLAGAGEGAVFSANSDYGSLGQQFERVGRTFQDLQLQRHAAISEALAPSVLKIKNNPQLAAEWGNFTFVRHSNWRELCVP